MPDARAPGRSERLTRNAGVTVVGALGGVVAGLLLDVAIAATYGAGRSTDSLFVALRVPIGVAVIVMAAANQSLVPTFTRWHASKDTAGFSRSVSKVFTATLLLSASIALLGTVAARPLVAITAPGLSPEVADRAADLARLLFWLVPSVCTAEVLRAYMNARRRFGVPAAMNVVMNGVAAALIIYRGQDDIRVAALAYVLGAAAQLVFMVVMAARTGLRLRPVVAAFDREVRELGRISVRPLTAAGLNPVARLVEQAVISYLPSGSITIVNYANRLISAIGGTVLFRSVMVVLLPRLTSAWQAEDKDQVRSLVRRGVLLMLRLAVPLTALMCVLGVPGAVVVFDRGEFTRAEAVLLGVTLGVYATSLVGQALQRVLLAPFYAALSMKVPFRNSIYGVLANLALLPPVVLLLRDEELAALAGVAVAFSVAQYVNVAHAGWHLRTLVGPVSDRSLVLSTWVIVGAGLAQTAVLAAGGLLLGLYDEQDRVDLLVRTGLVSLAGFGLFAGIVLGTDRLRRARRRRHAALSETA